MIVLFVSILAIVLTTFLYYKTLMVAPLRILSIILLYFLITNFVFSISVQRPGNPPAVLIDYSGSMKQYIPSVMQKVATLKFPHARFYFHESLFTDISSERIPSSRYTDILGAVITAQQQQPSAIVLISDGNQNFGTAAVAAMKNFTTPIYSFGIGSPAQRDIAIVDVVYPEYIVAGDSVKIEVVVQSQGFQGGRGHIDLTRNRIPAARDSFLLSDVRANQTIDFVLHVTRPRAETLRLEVLPQPGEQTYENNTYECVLTVMQEKLNVLYYTEHPSFNTRFTLRSLDQDEYCEVLPLALINRNTYVDMATDTRQTVVPRLEQFDVVLLDNVNLDRLPFKNIDVFVKQGLGILCMGTLDSPTGAWLDMLPIVTLGIPMSGTYQIKVRQPFSCLSPADDYPPLSSINRVARVQENATVIADVDDIPLLAYTRYGRGMVFQINATDMGSWRFAQQGILQRDIVSCLIADAIRFASFAGQNNRCILRSVRRDYTVGETIELTLQSFDRDFRRTGGGDFYLVYDADTVPFFETQKGVYKSSLRAERTGSLKLRATGKLGEENLTSNELDVTVRAGSLEADRGLNEEFLKTLARASGGSYHVLDDIDTVTITTAHKRRVRKNLSFDTPVSYVLIIAFLSIDWILRRRRGTV